MLKIAEKKKQFLLHTPDIFIISSINEIIISPTNSSPSLTLSSSFGAQNHMPKSLETTSCSSTSVQGGQNHLGNKCSEKKYKYKEIRCQSVYPPHTYTHTHSLTHTHTTHEKKIPSRLLFGANDLYKSRCLSLCLSGITVSSLTIYFSLEHL